MKFYFEFKYSKAGVKVTYDRRDINLNPESRKAHISDNLNSLKQSAYKNLADLKNDSSNVWSIYLQQAWSIYLQQVENITVI